jgi:hypothetical protein
MPWDKTQYPVNWDSEIRPAMRRRADDCCEGSPRYPDCRAQNYTPHPETGSRVILTTAHLCRCVPKCAILDHLRLLCQRCHLSLDLDLHRQHRIDTLRRERERQGQLPFWEH